MESVNYVQYKQCAVTEFLVAKKETERDTYKYFCSVYGSAVIGTNTTDCLAKRGMASEMISRAL
jgi:hypothetical protein